MKYGYMLLILLILALAWQHAYFNSELSLKDTLANMTWSELSKVKQDYQVEEHEQVDYMNREIMQSDYDLAQLRWHRDEAKKEIKNPSDKILNPQNYYSIENWVVVEITR